MIGCERWKNNWTSLSAMIWKRCYMHLVSYRGQLKPGESHIRLHILTMLLLSLGMNLLEISRLAIFLRG
jgi:hypothetical protein